MSIDLEKIDIIRDRLDVSYREAKEALERTCGDVIEAIVLLEKELDASWTGKVQKRSGEVIHRVGSYLKKRSDTKIKFKQGEKTLFEIPATVGALGVIGALASTQLAVVAGIGTVAAMANKVTMEFDKEEQHQHEPEGEESGEHLRQC